MANASTVAARAWTPILKEGARVQAIDTARSIAREPRPTTQSECWWEAALLDSYLAELDGDLEAGKKALAGLFRIEASAPVPDNPGALGLAGFGWLVQHLRHTRAALRVLGILFQAALESDDRIMMSAHLLEGPRKGAAV